jgi:alkane 1-monooxygenase
MKKDFKYLIAYFLPLSVFLGLYFRDIWSFAGIFVGFVAIPILEQFLTGTTENLSENQSQIKEKSFFFDLLLYLNLPILYAIVAFYFYSITTPPVSLLEIIGMTSSTGMLIGTLGINVAHELGHRSGKIDQWFAKALLVPALYTHFTIEHNLGHHKNVATDLDPASAKKNETIYAFWWRSVKGTYLNAWKINQHILKKNQKSFLSLSNDLLLGHALQLIYLSVVGLLAGPSAIFLAISIAIVGFLLLESVNYIEHYGLRRNILPNGKMETVMPWHSWNSNHELGRIFLYELTRHSDHHFKATRKYQILRHFDESPQLPFGYPGSILLALLPPFWFKKMNPTLLKFTSLQNE